MSRGDVQALVRYLRQMSIDGCSVLTWNGLGFDFDILSEESGSFKICRELALGHVDMMFHVFCSLGYPVSLDKSAQGAGLPGKTAGMSGDKAPTLWAQGHYQKVLDYVAQDVRVAMEIALTCERRRKFEWITRKGTKSSLALANGWLTVEESLKLAEPDTSWMSSPLHRVDFTNWLAPHR